MPTARKRGYRNDRVIADPADEITNFGSDGKPLSLEVGTLKNQPSVNVYVRLHKNQNCAYASYVLSPRDCARLHNILPKNTVPKYDTIKLSPRFRGFGEREVRERFACQLTK